MPKRASAPGAARCLTLGSELVRVGHQRAALGARVDRAGKAAEGAPQAVRNCLLLSCSAVAGRSPSTEVVVDFATAIVLGLMLARARSWGWRGRCVMWMLF